MQKLVCELCGSNDFTKDDHGFFVCDYCRTKYTPEQAKSMIVQGTVRVDRSGEVESLLALANTALSGGNLQEALDYSNRALEVDHENSNGWCLKGTAAGWMSTPQVPRLKEMLQAYSLAVEKSDGAGRPAMQQWCAARSTDISKHLMLSSTNFVEEHGALNGVWNGHVAISEEALSALAAAYQWDPNPDPLRIYTSIAIHLINGARYRGPTGKIAKHKVSREYRHNLEARIDWAAAQIVRFDPAYVRPKNSKLEQWIKDF